jgi:hypothetical protein
MMTDNNQSEQMVDSALPQEDEASADGEPSRRDAVAIVAKHALYTSPAVLAVLSIETKRATAGSF